jgi:kynurenine formamidase
MARLGSIGLAAIGALFACHAARETPAPRVLVDLSYPFDAETVYWPTEEGFVLERGPAGYTDGGYYYAANRFRAAEHGGTHIDAPLHFAEGHQSVDAIPLERLIGAAALVDVSAACAADRDHAVSIADLESDEHLHGRIPDAAIVLLRTGWGERWPDRARYLGTSARGPAAVAELHFPGLGADAARWLLEQRHVQAVGLDTASIDPGVSTRFETHRLLFAHDVPALENLANLQQLPSRDFEVVALPMKIRGGSGGPLRAVAILAAGAR